ncbi:hypothetical protein [Actinospongicola halichondriae]|uniref:hypothetical protein n=1 Tax=Actinospongicola halichondriae TaxID=3236844 RepID=UPI003D3CED5D
MKTLTRVAMLAVAGLVLSGCDLIVSPDRVLEGSGETITISSGQLSALDGSCDGDVEVFASTGDADPVSLGETTAVGGVWSLDVTAPADRGSYAIFAECDGDRSFFDEELIVQPEFAPTATPTQYVTGAEPDVITVAGDWCITSLMAFEDVFMGPPPTFGEPIDEVVEEELPFPTVTGILGAEELTAVALEHQPFDDDWVLEFAAPTEPGVHQLEITCTYFDFVSGTSPVSDIVPVDPEFDVTALAVDPADLPDYIALETVTSIVPIQVDGILETDGDALTEGDSVTVNNATSSPCDGVVTVRLSDGETTVSDTPEVGDDGTWTTTFDDLAVGDHTVDASCVGTEDAGSFSYEPVVLSVAERGVTTTTSTTTTTTTTAPPTGKVAAAAAQPTAAQPAFTG